MSSTRLKTRRMVGPISSIDKSCPEAAGRPGAREREDRPAASGAGHPPRSGLGNTTNFTDEFSGKVEPLTIKNQRLKEVLDPETGETFSYVYDEKRQQWVKAYDADAAEMERWLLLRSAQRILGRPQYWEERLKKSRHVYTDLTAVVEYCDVQTREIVKVAAHLIDQPVQRAKLYDIEGTRSWSTKFRVVRCYLSKVAGRQPELWKSPKSGRVAWHNVGVCGSVWTCPCCAPKINLRRREEIALGYEAVAAANGVAYMMTYTIKHGIGDDLNQLVTKEKEAMQLLQKSQAFKEVTRKAPLKRPRAGSLPYLGYLGRIANLEITHGEKNGWHPHEHHLWFFKRELTARELERVRSSLFDAWSDACNAVGLPRPLKTIKVAGKVRYLGLDVRKAMSASEYLSKFGHERLWAPEKELASSHVKQAKAKGRTPFQLLAEYADGNAQAGQKFVEFAEAFLGRHQLQFSRTLKAWLADHQIEIDDGEEGDLAHAASLQDDSEKLGQLSDTQFEKVTTNRAHSSVLAICRIHGFASAVRFIDSLSIQPGRQASAPWAS